MRRVRKYKAVSLKMHAVEQETFTWPHFCYLLKDFLIQQASDECIRSLSFSLPGTLSISFKFC